MVGWHHYFSCRCLAHPGLLQLGLAPDNRSIGKSFPVTACRVALTSFSGISKPVSERPRSLLLSLEVPSRPSPGSYPGPIQVPSRVRGGPVQIRHVLRFTVFRTHPGPEVGAIPARPGPILLPSVPSRVGPGRAETDFLATSDCLLTKHRQTDGFRESNG